MTFFRALQGNPLFIIFTLLSLGYFFNGLRLAHTWWQRRQAFARNPLQPWKKDMVERAAFLLAVPPGVFFHELCHAVAIWSFGGAVADAGFGFYWGYVSTPDTFSAAQDWFISLAGTLGTLLYGFVLWFLLRRQRSQAWRYFGLRALRFHLYYALLYYPAFTLFTFIGDWRTIYDFADTPLLSGATLLLHVASLGFFWWSDRQGWYEMPAFQSQSELQALQTLQDRVEHQPQDMQAQLRLIDTLRRQGARKAARQRLRRFLASFPHSAEGHLISAYLEAEGKNQLPRTARDSAERALKLGLSDNMQTRSAHALLGQYYLQIEKTEDALRHLDEALALGGYQEAGSNIAQLYYLRALAQRRRGAYVAASQDIEEAIRLARQEGREQLVSRLENERQTIAHHRGDASV